MPTEVATMRISITALAVVLFGAVSLAEAASGQIFSASPAMPLVRTPTNQSTIHVSGGPAVVSSLRVVMRLSHQCDSDLDIVLVHGNTYLRLSSANGGMGQSYYPTRFSDSGPQAIYEGQPPYNGTFRPEGGVLVPFGNATPLPPNAAAGFVTFSGQSGDGDWTLWIDDTADGYTGTLEYWSLEFNGAVDPNGPALAYGGPMASTWTEQGDAGDLPGTAQACTGDGPLTQIVGSLGTGDVDVYQIHVCDPANFSATTVGGAYFDTRLYLFDSAGNGVSFNDEEPGDTSQSVLSSAFVASEGVYYLAISAGGKFPVDRLNHNIWQDEPAVAERQPDGEAAGNPLAGWSGWPQGGDYRISLTGACKVGRPCPAMDFNGDGDMGTDADILAFFACLQGDCCPTCASVDIDQDGDVGTDADIAAFFRIFTQGC
jgi:hypothetical protein